MVETDFIIDKNGNKKFRFYCSVCKKDRGYKGKWRRGGSLTSARCVQCANSRQKDSHCKFCNENIKLPTKGSHSDHWRWDKNKSSPNGGYFRCKVQMAVKNTKWMKENPEKYKKKQQKGSIKYRSTPQGKIRSVISSRMSQSIHKRNGKCNYNSKITYVNWTMEELMTHLESKFTEGMSWDNYGEWHIDHVVPDSWFDYGSITDVDFSKSWSLNNLQPLWAKDNLSKNNRFAGGVSSQY